jgi:hypothetical protein
LVLLGPLADSAQTIGKHKKSTLTLGGIRLPRVEATRVLRNDPAANPEATWRVTAPLTGLTPKTSSDRLI